MNIQCPKCQQVSEVAFEVAEGQHIRCPYCGVKFAYGSGGSVVIGQAENVQEIASKAEAPRKRRLVWPIVVALILASIIGCFHVFSPDRIHSPLHDASWSASRGSMTDPLGERNGIIVKVSQFAIRGERYLQNGGVVFVESDDHLVSIWEIVKATDGDSHFGYRRISQYDISEKEQWNKLKFELSVILNPTPANEIISFVRKYRKD